MLSCRIPQNNVHSLWNIILLRNRMPESENVLELHFLIHPYRIKAQSDEAWFHLTGYVNAQNYRVWSQANPRVFRESSLHPQKVGVWCALSRRRLVGPIFFETTITAARYRDIIMQFIALLEPEERNCWFQQDNATAHTAHETMDFLATFFDDRLISRNLWPPRSPDLTPADFFYGAT